MTGEQAGSVELAIFRGEVLTSLEAIRGELKLVLKHGELSDLRAAEIVDSLRRIGERTGNLEQTRATRAELSQLEAEWRAELATFKAEQAEKGRKNLAVIGLTITGASTVVGAVVSLIN